MNWPIFFFHFFDIIFFVFNQSNSGGSGEGEPQSLFLATALTLLTIFYFNTSLNTGVHRV